MTREQLESFIAWLPPELIAFGILAVLAWVLLAADPPREEDRPGSPWYRG